MIERVITFVVIFATVTITGFMKEASVNRKWEKQAVEAGKAEYLVNTKGELIWRWKP